MKTKKSESLVGKKFGKLLVLRYLWSDGERRWLCQCECGNRSVVRTRSLNYSTRSCGCIRVEKAAVGYNTRHGATKKQTKTTTYAVWSSMKQRCYNPKV